MYYQYVGIRWKFCACTKFLGVHDVRQRMPAFCSVPLTYAKLMPNVCNVHQRMDKISHTSAYVGAIRCGVSTSLTPPRKTTEISNVNLSGYMYINTDFPSYFKSKAGSFQILNF